MPRLLAKGGKRAGLVALRHEHVADRDQRSRDVSLPVGIVLVLGRERTLDGEFLTMGGKTRREGRLDRSV